MTTSYGNTVGVVTVVAGAIFLGYYLYFDHRRRSDPEKKLRERRDSSSVKGKQAREVNSHRMYLISSSHT